MKQARIYRNKKAQAEAVRRYGLIATIAVGLVVIMGWLWFIGYWPWQRYSYMESDPIHQPYAGVYAVVSKAWLHPSPKRRNQRLAAMLASDLGYKYWVQLDEKEGVLFSPDFLDGWPIAMQVIEQDFATRPILAKQQATGDFGLYYFFNNMQEMSNSELLAQYISDKRARKTPLRPFWSKLDRKQPLTSQAHAGDEGIVTLVVWDSSMSQMQRRSPFSTLLQAAEEHGQAQGYDGFIILSYRYIREHQLDFDVFFVRHHSLMQDLAQLAAAGFEYSHQDVFFFN